jgi:predicted RNA-binding protein with PUA-like domain
MPEPARRYWLMKSEPDAFSIADLEKKGTAPWDGVRAYAARSNMEAMQLGDLVLFYHSSCVPPGAVGIARVAKLAYPDPTQFDPKSQYFDPKSKPDAPRWRMVDVEFVSTFPRMVTLDQMRGAPELAQMVVVKPGRLSVQPVTEAEFVHVVGLGGGKVPKSS